MEVKGLNDDFFCVFTPGNQLLLGCENHHQPLERRGCWNYQSLNCLPDPEVNQTNIVYGHCTLNSELNEPVALESAITYKDPADTYKSLFILFLNKRRWMRKLKTWRAWCDGKRGG